MSQTQQEQANISCASANGNTSSSSLVPGGVVTTQNISTVIKPKENNNSMQFVKITPPDLSKKAVEQIRVAQESKISKDKLKEVEEEWQSNLMKWKSKRRQLVGHNASEEINEAEQNNNDGSGRKVKTFAQIIEQRSRSNNRLNFNLQRYIDTGDEDDRPDNDNSEPGERIEPQHQQQQQEQQHPQLVKPTLKQEAPIQHTLAKPALKHALPPKHPLVEFSPKEEAPPQHSPVKPMPKQEAPSQHSFAKTIQKQEAPVQHSIFKSNQKQDAPLQNSLVKSIPKLEPTIQQHSLIKTTTKQEAPLQHSIVKPTLKQEAPLPPQSSLVKPIMKQETPPQNSLVKPTLEQEASPPQLPFNNFMPKQEVAPIQYPLAPKPVLKQAAPPRPLSQNQFPKSPLKQEAPAQPEIGSQESARQPDPRPLPRRPKDRTVLSVSGKRLCSSCKEELGRGAAAFVVESLNLAYHTNCFKCSVCHVDLSNGFRGVDVRVHAGALHCQNCYSKDGLNYSRV